MSESRPPTQSLVPPPPTNSMAYIVVVVLLLGAIGGILVWKLKAPASGPTPVNTVPTGPATGSPPPTFVEPPPPPPPIEEVTPPDGGPQKVAPASTGPSFSQCNAPTCSGTASSALQGALAQRAGSARSCYERALRVNSALQGKVMIQVRVDSAGNVCSASVVQDDIHSNEVTSCVTRSFRSAKLPPASGGCVDVKVPLSFVPQQGK